MSTLWTAFWEATGLTKEQRILVVRVGWVSVVSVHIAWVCGWLGVLGVQSPFAHADALTTLVQAVGEDRLERIDHEIQQVRALQCRTGIDTPARQNYSDRLIELYNKYVVLSHGVQPRVPHCDET